MNKPNLIKIYVAGLETELRALKEAAKATYDASTHEEAKPENQYDTRALENSYLAGAQAKRANDIEEVLGLFLGAELRNFASRDAVALTALIRVETAGKKNDYLMMSKGGGLIADAEGRRVMVLTPASQLGEALLDLRVGESVEAEINGQTREYKLLEIC